MDRTDELSQSTTSSALGGCNNASELREFLEAQSWWCSLPPALRFYYICKARYYSMSRDVIAIAVAAVLILVGLLSYLNSQKLDIALILIVVGVVIGILAAWEIERRR